jgi:hypothetical protein
MIIALVRLLVSDALSESVNGSDCSIEVIHYSLVFPGGQPSAPQFGLRFPLHLRLRNPRRKLVIRLATIVFSE